MMHGAFSFAARVCRSAIVSGNPYSEAMFRSASFQRLIASLMVACLLVTSGAMAVARSQAETGTLMVICSSHGYATIQIDQGGTPIERQVVCPDCVLAFPAEPGRDAILPREIGLGFALASVAPDQLSARDLLVRFSARGPPALG